MGVLYICHKPIYPARDGGQVAMKAFFESLLSCVDKVTVCFLGTTKHPFELEAIPKPIQDKCKIHVFEIDTEIKIFAALKDLILGRAYNINRFYNSKISDKIIDLCQADKINTVFFESLYSAIYADDLQKKSNIKLIVRSHNVEHNIWKTLSERSNSFLKRFYFKQLSKNLAKVESEILSKMNLVLSISAEDSKYFKEKMKLENIRDVYFSQEEAEFENDYSNMNIGHIGSMNWQPNVQAVDFIIEQIIPQLEKPHLVLAGSFMPEDQKYYGEQITNLGKVDELEQFYKKCGILVVPVCSGSGIKIKVLEAMSFGIPVITTKIGAEGLNIENNKELIVVEKSSEFVKAITELQNNIEMRKSIGEAAKAYVKKHHNPIEINKEICQIINGN